MSSVIVIKQECMLGALLQDPIQYTQYGVSASRLAHTIQPRKSFNAVQTFDNIGWITIISQLILSSKYSGVILYINIVEGGRFKVGRQDL